MYIKKQIQQQFGKGVYVKHIPHMFAAVPLWHTLQNSLRVTDKAFSPQLFHRRPGKSGSAHTTVPVEKKQTQKREVTTKMELEIRCREYH